MSLYVCIYCVDCERSEGHIVGYQFLIDCEEVNATLTILSKDRFRLRGVVHSAGGGTDDGGREGLLVQSINFISGLC